MKTRVTSPAVAVFTFFVVSYVVYPFTVTAVNTGDDVDGVIVKVYDTEIGTAELFSDGNCVSVTFYDVPDVLAILHLIIDVETTSSSVHGVVPTVTAGDLAALKPAPSISNIYPPIAALSI